jgi:hypothetical protein
VAPHDAHDPEVPAEPRRHFRPRSSVVKARVDDQDDRAAALVECADIGAVRGSRSDHRPPVTTLAVEMPWRLAGLVAAVPGLREYVFRR